jgi:hypothetical protein
MDQLMEITRSFGLGGLGLLAAVLSVRLAVQVVDLVRAQQRSVLSALRQEFARREG